MATLKWQWIVWINICSVMVGSVLSCSTLTWWDWKLLFLPLLCLVLVPTHALVCPRLCLSFCQFLSPSHMSVFHPFSPLILPPFSPYSSFSNFCPSDMLLVFSFPLCSLNTLKGPACPALSVVGHRLGVQRDRNPWSCDDWKGYSSEDQCFFFFSISTQKTITHFAITGPPI